jgi:NO-binding membrane sensor protein with MHYT domain
VGPCIDWDFFIVAFIASFIALDSAGKVAISSRRESTFWRLSGGATLGMGIWSMHFIGMLAMKMSMPINYHLSLTAFSFFIALISATVAINIAISGNTLSTKRLLITTGYKCRCCYNALRWYVCRYRTCAITWIAR